MLGESTFAAPMEGKTLDIGFMNCSNHVEMDGVYSELENTLANSSDLRR